MKTCKECVEKSDNKPNCNSCYWANAVTGKCNNVIKVNYLSNVKPAHKPKARQAEDSTIDDLVADLDVENLA